jgi:hypothetical protein
VDASDRKPLFRTRPCELVLKPGASRSGGGAPLSFDCNMAARAAELIAGDDRIVGAEHIEHARRRATLTVVDVLKRYPEAPRGGGRFGELLRDLDQALRSLF